MRVRLRIPEWEAGEGNRGLSPDEDAPQTIQPTASGQSVTFEVSHLATYGVVRVSLQ